MANATAAIATCGLMGISVRDCAEALSEFKGIARRMQILGKSKGVTVMDDFAHNPDKIMATLKINPVTIE